MSSLVQEYEKQSPLMKIAIPVAAVVSIYFIALYAGFIPGKHAKGGLGSSIQDSMKSAYSAMTRSSSSNAPHPLGVIGKYQRLGDEQHFGKLQRQGSAHEEYNLSRVQGSNSELDIMNRRAQGTRPVLNDLGTRGPAGRNMSLGANSEIDINRRVPQGANNPIDILGPRGLKSLGAEGIEATLLTDAYSTSYDPNASKPDVPDTRVGAVATFSDTDASKTSLSQAYGSSYAGQSGTAYSEDVGDTSNYKFGAANANYTARDYAADAADAASSLRTDSTKENTFGPANSNSATQNSASAYNAGNTDFLGRVIPKPTTA